MASTLLLRVEDRSASASGALLQVESTKEFCNYACLVAMVPLVVHLAAETYLCQVQCR